MHRVFHLRRVAIAAVLLVALASPAAATWSTSPFTSTPLCTAAGTGHFSPVIVPDGSGGAFVAWGDDRLGGTIYATHVAHDGTLVPGWPVDGISVCGLGSPKYDVRLVAGGAGDVFVVWEDTRAGNFDIYAQRVLGNGTIAPGWPANGLALANDARNQDELAAAADGAGGLYAVWTLEYTPGTDYDVYATRVLPSGSFAPSYGVNGIAINAGAYNQNQPDIAADGAGNAIIVYANEDNTATATIWGQKLTAAGALAWGTPSAGLMVSSLGNDQRQPHVVTDGAGGAIVSDVFSNVEAYYVAIDGNGNRRGQLLENLPSGGGPYKYQLTADGAGGGWVAWRLGGNNYAYGYLEHLDPRLHSTTASAVQVYYDRSTLPPAVVPMPGASVITTWGTFTNNVQAQGYDTNIAPLWGGSSVMVAGAVNAQFDVQAASDGADGAIVVWCDQRNGTSAYDIYAARVDRFGALGNAAPAFTRLADVPNDQGGFVSLQWTASYRDAAPSFPIARYSIWRRVPGGIPALRAGETARVIAAGAARPEGATRVIRAEPSATSVAFWEYLSQVPARGYAGYSAVAPTTSDSLPGSNPRTSFRIEAESSSGIPYWDSAPDSTYSVDNIAPKAPAPFTGTFAGGTATLAWQPNSEPDIGVYRLYRGASPSFVPSPANLVSEQSQTGFADAAGTPYWYKLVAVDVHGNVSPASTLLPTGVTGVAGAALPRELALAPPTPNPARGGTLLGFALPHAANVSLAIFDAAGRRVRVLASGAWPAGEHTLRWDGSDESGHASGPGLYFVRLDADGRVVERRIARVG